MTIATEAPKKTLRSCPGSGQRPKYGPTLELNQHPAKRYPFRFAGEGSSHPHALDAIKAFADEHPL